MFGLMARGKSIPMNARFEFKIGNASVTLRVFEVDGKQAVELTGLDRIVMSADEFSGLAAQLSTISSTCIQVSGVEDIAAAAENIGKAFRRGQDPDGDAAWKKGSEE